MGGCRCSYRNCTVRSDKKTHMFHFPVFEKLRCHQWIIQARRYEYMDLTVSQLRNRVMCQHHFKDECFMNYKKDKLRFDAVPTEDGPYCDSSKDIIIDSEAAEKASLVLNDIEQEPSYIDKKANSSLKYIDFLASFDASEEKSDNWIDIPPKQKPTIGDNKNVIFKDKRKPNIIRKIFSSPTKIIKDPPVPKKNNAVFEFDQSKELDAQNDYTKNEPSIMFNNNENQEINNISNLSMAPLQVIENVNHYQQPIIVPLNNEQCIDFNLSNQGYFHQNQSITTSNVNDNYNLKSSENSVQPQSSNERVKILSEKTIYQPIPHIGQFVPVLPSLVLQVPNRMKQSQGDSQIIQSDPQNSMSNKEIESAVVETKPNVCENEISEDLKNNDIVIKIPPQIDILEIDSSVQKLPSLTEKSNTELTATTCEISKELQEKTTEVKEDSKSIPGVQSKQSSPLSKVSLLKTKVTPERLAAIEKKRIFNKKLRDIVESCLEKPEDQEDISNRVNILKMKDNENVDTNHSKDKALSKSQDYTITYLEARMQKMENLLLKKIEQNSNRISDLKNCIAPRKRSSVYTQTPISDQAQKIYLYEEISKFLSSKAKDLIYEELFIYKYAEKAADQGSKVKRKRRR